VSIKPPTEKELDVYLNTADTIWNQYVELQSKNERDEQMFDGMMDEYCTVHRVEGGCAQCKAKQRHSGWCDLARSEFEEGIYDKVPLDPTAQSEPELCIDEGCPHYGTAHVCITPEPKGPSVEQLREELILRNQEIEDLRLTNRNLSRKLAESVRALNLLLTR
jgi:hypothetical protein